MSAAHHHRRHALDCGLRVMGALAAVLLATAAVAASPLGGAAISTAAAPSPLLYAQLKSLWKNQPQPGQQPPPAAQQQQPDQPPGETDEPPEEAQPPGPAPQQPAQGPAQPPTYGQPVQPPGPPPGYPQQPQRPGQPPIYGQPGQPPGYPAQQQQQRPGQRPVYGQPGQPPVYGQPGQPPMQQRPGQPPVYGQPGQPPGPGGPQPGQPPVYGQPNIQLPADGRLQYRGFNIDATAIVGSPQYAEVMMSLPRQVDIVLESGLKPEVVRFFQGQVITVRPDIRGPGHFSSREPGIAVAAVPADPNKPIVLHELLHAYHWYLIPGAFRNPQIISFYERGRSVYPPNSYVTRNVQEFFAVTGSLYLWGHVDRPPNTREALRQAQPVYYQWLGQLFGVQK